MRAATAPLPKIINRFMFPLPGHKRIRGEVGQVGKLDGKVAIVTGTSRGVGVGISRQLLVEGATVVGCSRNELPALPAAVDVLGGAERSAQWVCDQGDYQAIDAFVSRVVDTYGRIDILVNNAGGTCRPFTSRQSRARAEDQGSPRSTDASNARAVPLVRDQMT